MADEQQESLRNDAQRLAIARLITGAVQGLALYLLYSTYDAQSWPATQGEIFAPLMLIALFLPLLVNQGLGNIRPRTLIVWTVAAAVVLAGLGGYDIWRAWPEQDRWINGVRWVGKPVLPSFALVFFSAAGLFIAHVLVTGGDTDRRWRATYPTHFDVAWKFGVQLALSAAFTGALWLLLWLGSGLFQLINLNFLEKLIEHEWFSIPLTTLAVATALHITDVRAGLVRGARTLALVLLSWLLPLMTLFAVGFFAALPFTGLDPLWKTKTAASLLLISAGALVILINATYQDGESEHHSIALVLRYAARAAALVLVPVTLLAAYAIVLRVQQYGWTMERVSSAVVAAIALGYAGGYAWAAVKPGPWLSEIQPWNFAMSLAALAALFAIFTPLLDPARIAVNDQMARLAKGAVTPQAFDFNFLRRADRFGYAALSSLKQHGSTLYVRATAADILAPAQDASAPATSKTVAADIAVFPKGRTLPADFVTQDWKKTGGDLPACLTQTTAFCDARFADLDGDGKDELILYPGLGQYPTTPFVFAEDANGHWAVVGTLNVPPNCTAAATALRSGSVTVTAPQAQWHDLEAGGARLRFIPLDACKP